MKSASDWFDEPSLFATSAVLLCTDAFGTEFFSWDPTTLNLELTEGFGITPSEELLDKLSAASALFTSNLFFHSLEAFAAVCQSLNFGVVIAGQFIPPDLNDIVWGVTEASVLLGDDFAEDTFSHNIATYAGRMLQDNGVPKPPAVLEFAEMDEAEISRTQEFFAGNDLELLRVHDEKVRENARGLEVDRGHQLLAMFSQLTRLPLDHGSTTAIRERLDKAMGNTTTAQ